MMTKDKMLEKAQNAKRESKYIDFKERFDVNFLQDWCEIIKDIVAMTNSGGGVILIGVRNNSMPSGVDVTPVLNLDSAQWTDKIAKYTEKQFSEFEIMEINKDGHKVAVFLVYGVSIPLVFIKPGTYDIGDRGDRVQQIAFRKGTVYFRHGAKSEPGNSNDIRKVIERELERIRKSWLGDIRKVVKAPPGYRVQVLPPNVRVSTRSTSTPIRIVETPDAPVYRLEALNDTHPYRQKDVIQFVNHRLGSKKTINAYDILCARKVYKIDETKPQYYYKPKYGTPQYSDAFVDWLVKCYDGDPLFFDNVRNKYKSLRK